MGGAYDEGKERGRAHPRAVVRNREERGLFLKLTEKDGLWKKIRNHVGTTVEHPVSPATRNIRARISDEGVKKSVSVCPYCAVGCSTLVYHRDGRIIDIDRKSTRLNSSHANISYAVFCLKKNKEAT